MTVALLAKPSLASQVARLFARGEQGAWYDPSDLSTLFQDAAGTIPVTGAGHPVGLMLDKRLGLALGQELFSDAVATTVGEATRTSPNVYRIYSSTGTLAGVQQAGVLTPGKTYKIEFNIDSITVAGSGVAIDNNGVSAAVFTTVGKKTAYVTAAAGYTTLLLKRQFGATDIQVSGLTVRELPGNHAAQSTSTSRPVLQFENGLAYLACDGVDDGMVTGNIDFSGTDKITVVAGVRKLSDAAVGTVLELSAIYANPGTFALFAPSLVNGNDFAFGLCGTQTQYARVMPLVAPLTIVGSAKLDIGQSAKEQEFFVRLNGSVVTPIWGNAATTVGSGNFGNYALYLFRRGGTTLPFNGRFYGAVIRGTESTESQIRAVERYLNSKTRAW